MAWPPAAERLDMLEEAIGLMRRLWSGELVTHRGAHYNVDTARIYTLPEEPPPIYMSGFGTTAAKLAGRVADGFICTAPDRELVRTFRVSGGEGKVNQGAVKVCWGTDRARAVKRERARPRPRSRRRRPDPVAGIGLAPSPTDRDLYSDSWRTG